MGLVESNGQPARRKIKTKPRQGTQTTPFGTQGVARDLATGYTMLYSGVLLGCEKQGSSQAGAFKAGSGPLFFQERSKKQKGGTEIPMKRMSRKGIPTQRQKLRKPRVNNSKAISSPPPFPPLASNVFNLMKNIGREGEGMMLNNPSGGFLKLPSHSQSRTSTSGAQIFIPLGKKQKKRHPVLLLGWWSFTEKGPLPQNTELLGWWSVKEKGTPSPKQVERGRNPLGNPRLELGPQQQLIFFAWLIKKRDQFQKGKTQKGELVLGKNPGELFLVQRAAGTGVPAHMVQLVSHHRHVQTVDHLAVGRALRVDVLSLHFWCYSF